MGSAKDMAAIKKKPIGKLPDELGIQGYRYRVPVIKPNPVIAPLLQINKKK